MSTPDLVEGLKTVIREAVREEIRAALESHNGSREALLLTTREAAELLGVPPTWIGAKARAGDIATVRLGAHVRFRREDLEQFIESKTVPENENRNT